MAEIYDFEAAKARLRVKRAERSLDRANELLNEETRRNHSRSFDGDVACRGGVTRRCHA